MKTVGVIAEYNPFHTGHEYHLKKAREAAGADYVIVVMSPDFVQRGEPALLDKHTRTHMALSCGADLVLELPVCYAAGSAEYFAEGAVSILDRLGVTDTLCFGAEKDNTRLFHLAARILSAEPTEYRASLQARLKKGLTFPQARSAALNEYLLADASDPSLAAELKNFLETPNNILGIEYCKALQKNMSPIVPLPVTRNGSEYNSLSLEGNFCSASAIRKVVHSGDEQNKIIPYIPSCCQSIFEKTCTCSLSAEDLLLLLRMRLLDLSSAEQLAGILDISEDLADRIFRQRYECLGASYDECVQLLKTRQMTESRIRRALLHLILDIRTNEIESYRQNGTAFYAHVLGFRKEASVLLHRIKEESDIPLITKPAQAEKLIAAEALPMWKKDLYATHLYRSMQNIQHGLPFRNAYQTGPVIV